MTDKFFNIYTEEVELAGRKLVLETGHIARQADGAVTVKYGDTVVLCTVVGAKKVKEDTDFFPLTVNYQEKTFATGRIPGGFFKREGKPSEGEVLTSRLIDRPIRPLFPDNFYNEVQIICTVLSHDHENSPDVVAIIGASAALAISGIPFDGPISAARVGIINGEFKLNPTITEMKTSQLDLVVAGTKDGVLMVESEAQELDEKMMLDAIKFGHDSFNVIIKAIDSLKKKAGKADWSIPEQDPRCQEIEQAVRKTAESQLKKAYLIKEKLPRHEAIDACKEEVIKELCKNHEGEDGYQALVKRAFEKLEYNLLRTEVLENGKRVDGRKLDEIRPIRCEVGVLPRAHGSALFTRGETQALVTTTLGSGEDEQLIDGLLGDYKERFLVHYNFPPYAVGEVGRMSSPGRREIGHGRLAWRAIHPLVLSKTVSKDAFPYTIRLVSEVTESNGSSSMATVCGSSLALMDAGVPIQKTISGIAMGLIKEKDQYAVLSDIQGDEDHLGDMDFKVAGTKDGITALQMDIKIKEITFDIMEKALAQAKEGRAHIANEMNKALSEPRAELNSFAPQIIGIQIDKDKIRDLIGTGGKVIREVCEKTGAKIDITDDGQVSVFGPNRESIEAAMAMIDDIVGEPEVGQIYTGPVVKIAEFGAFVNFFGKRDGLVHISELSENRVENVEDVLKVGDVVKVVLLGIDERTKKARLSIRAISQPQRVTNQVGLDDSRSRNHSRSTNNHNNSNNDRPRRSRDDSRGDRGNGDRRHSHDDSRRGERGGEHSSSRGRFNK